VFEGAGNASTISLSPGDWVALTADGSNYLALSGRSLGSPGVAPTFSIIGQTSCAGSGSAGCKTSGINTAGANLYIVGATSNNGAAPGVTDLSGDTFSTAVTAATSPDCTIYYVVNPGTNAAETFSTASPVTTLGALAVNIASPALDGTGVHATGSNVTTQQPGSMTPSAATDLAVAMVGWAGTGTITVNSGFTSFQSGAGSINNNFASLSAELQPTGTGALNPTFATNGGADRASACMALFK
jgi:hypothetical protein